jgi:chromosome segregation protein
MHFQRLRLSGFKSFVEATEFRIEPGLTGVVGPNGCGKSNLLEALRWVMGATSAKAMRAEGMDDVIFAGASSRPSRNHAEVLLQIDNSDRKAPAQFNHHPMLEVVRRIDRGSGSTYRVNGVETRARDVQLLFADASTGANSPSLVRQGQISELIAAKPSNRRRILEEAAGVSGLHSRRHEAELRLRAAENNLDRLDDVTKELESTLNRLKRESRQADKYKRLSSEIRALQGAAMLSRWQEAQAGLEAARHALTEAEAKLGAAMAEAAELNTAALTASEALKPLREEEQIAAAVLQRLTIERDRVEREEAQARADVERLKAEITRIEGDHGREGQIIEDAATTVDRLQRELADVERLLAEAPERIPQLEAALKEAETLRALSDAEVERLASEAAAEAARRRAAALRVEEAERAVRSGQTRLDEAAARVARTERAMEQARAERAQLAAGVDPGVAAAEARLLAAQEALTHARHEIERAEAARSDAQLAEGDARDEARHLDDDLRRLKTEAQALAALTRAPPGAKFTPALDVVKPERGYEAALAAALGEDLDAALDRKAPSFWAGADARTGDWPKGASPLAPLVKAPPELAARLAMTALVDRADGDRLQAVIPVGARLVSKEGDLWRWDGFVARAEAEKPAAKRMAQKARLGEIEALIAEKAPLVEAATAAHRVASERVRELEAAVRGARAAPQPLERTVAQAREEVERHAREAARRDARAQSLDETIARFAGELELTKQGQTSAEVELQALQAAVLAARADAPKDAGSSSDAALHAARTASTQARNAEAEARAALEGERRAREGRQRRKDGLGRDLTDWKRRTDTARNRLSELDRERERAEAALIRASDLPGEITARRIKLLDDFELAEARRRKAADALATAEAANQASDRDSRAAEARAAETREQRAAATARQEAAHERLSAVADQVRETTKMEPAQLAARLSEEAVAIPGDSAGVDQLLRDLERDREALGAVNLRAEEEASEHALRLDAMRSERADLTGAIARLRGGIEELNGEGRERLVAAFELINESFKTLFQSLFNGGQAELRLVESDDPLEAGLEIYACPPGKRLSVMSLMSGGEQALTATALIFAVFLANPSPICVLDEVDAPLDDANVDRFCRLLNEMRQRTETRFIAITHNPVTMSRMDRLFGVTMPERGISQLVSVDLTQAELLAAQ